MDLEFADVARLLNYTRTTHIDLEPIRDEADQWALYNGQYRVHTSAYPFSVLYLRPKATLAGLGRAAKEAFVPAHTQVVYAPSLDQRHRGPDAYHRQLFAAKAKGFWNTKDYLASFLRGELETYLSRLAALAPAFYIDPRIETPSGFVRKRPNPVYSLLVDDDPGCGLTQGMLGILLAEPGQGKTYMSQYLVSSLLPTKVVPIYIHSAQWHSMSLDDIGSIWKTIANSFRQFDAPIGWVEGHEDEFVNITLKAEIFRIVFDGFDEYVLWNRGRIDPLDVLETLSQLVIDTGARIVITSRTSFWQTNVAQEEADRFVERTKSAIYQILPFDQQHAANYFNKRFNEDQRAARAVEIYRDLAKSADEFVGRGFVLNLVADLAERYSAGVALPGQIGPNALEWVMAALCERETLRQKLPLTAAQQIHAFRQFASEVIQGAQPSTEMLVLAVQDAAPTLDVREIEETVDKFMSHPLISKAPKTDEWDWREEQIRNILLADHLIWLTSHTESHADALRRFIEKALLGGGAAVDLAATMVDILRSRHGNGGARREVESLIRKLLNADASSDDLARWQSDGRRLAVATASVAVDRLVTHGGSRMDRAELFLSVLGGPVLRQLPVSGTLARMDFSEVTFERCRFERVTWASCRFSAKTIFDRCHFVGGDAVHCENLGTAQWKNVTTDKEADAWIARMQISDGKRHYSQDDLRNDLAVVLKKFIIKGGLGLKSIGAGNLSRGPIRHSPHRDEIITDLMSLVLEAHEISGTSGGGINVRESAQDAMRFFAVNNVLIGPLQDVFESLRRKLRLTV